jgi:hypothetical protein
MSHVGKNDVEVRKGQRQLFQQVKETRLSFQKPADGQRIRGSALGV